MTSRSRLFAALGTMVLLGLAACGPSRSAGSPFDQPQASADGLRIDVENQNYNDVRLYAVSVRGRRSLGVVSANMSRTFNIPWPTQDELRIRMEFIAGRTMTTNRVNIGPGQRVELLITALPQNSVLRRR